MGNEGGDDTLLLETLEKRAILTALEKTGKPLVAAPMLGIGKTTLYRKMKEYGIPTSQKKRERQCQPKESVPSESPLG
jgi:DNA-binding NtrC family response regulator